MTDMPDAQQGKPDDDVARFNEGMALLKANRLDEAIERFRYAAGAGKDRPMEHYALGVALYRRGDLAAAREEFHKFIAMSGKDNRYLRQAKAILPVIESKLAAPAASAPAGETARAYDEAVEAYMRGDLAAAGDGFRRVLDTIPESKNAHNGLGLALLAMKDYEAAVAEFQRAIEIDPDYLDAINNLGLAWCDYGLERARKAFETALDKSPDFFDALVNLASLHYRTGEIALARRMWLRAAELRPDDPQVVRNLELFR